MRSLIILEVSAQLYYILLPPLDHLSFRWDNRQYRNPTQCITNYFC